MPVWDALGAGLGLGVGKSAPKASLGQGTSTLLFVLFCENLALANLSITLALHLDTEKTLRHTHEGCSVVFARRYIDAVATLHKSPFLPCRACKARKADNTGLILLANAMDLTTKPMP